MSPLCVRALFNLSSEKQRPLSAPAAGPRVLRPGTLGALTRAGHSPGLPKCRPELALQSHLAGEEGRGAPSRGPAAGVQRGGGALPHCARHPVPLPRAPASQVTLSS